MSILTKILLVIFLVVIILISLKLTTPPIRGGVDWDEMVIDTLNVSHKLLDKDEFKHSELIEVIEFLTKNMNAKLRFVLKDKEQTKYTKAELKQLFDCAKRTKNNIYVAIGKSTGKSHSNLGRDDACMLWLSYKHKVPIVSCDKFKDYKELAKTVPFELHVMNGSKDTYKIKKIDEIILHPPMRLLDFCSDKFLLLRNDFVGRLS